MPKILNKRSAAPATGMSVDRGTEWGNPFIMKSERDRDKVCAQFEAYARWRLTIEPEWLLPLRGQDLACWCAPKRCHAETLLRLANAPAATEGEG